MLGETQILGQVKAAYGAARETKRTGVVLTQLFERALNVAKMVHSATSISDRAVSVSSAAVELAKKIFAHLPEHTAMVLGAGETSELAARHLIRQGVTRLFVANRSPQRAEKLAQALQAKALLWEEFPEYLVQADIVLSSTSAPQPIIQRAMVQEVMRVRKHRPMFSGPFSFRKEVANQAQNELKGFVPCGASLTRHAPMTQNPFMKTDSYDGYFCPTPASVKLAAGLSG